MRQFLGQSTCVWRIVTQADLTANRLEYDAVGCQVHCSGDLPSIALKAASPGIFAWKNVL